MQKTNGFLILLALVAVILLGFIAGKVAEPPQAAPTYTPWPTYTPMPTYTPYPTATPILDPIAIATKYSSWSLPEMAAIVKNYPRVDGSTSTKPLQDWMVCHFYGLSGCQWGWYPFGYEREVLFTDWLNDGDYYIASEKSLPNTTHHGTHDAYVNLINGNTDFILVARLPSDDELALASKRGITLDARPFALDAFVMLAHADNPVDTLTLDQIRGIYSGQLTNWSQVGGNDAPIHAYQREANSGSQELLKSLVMGDVPVIDAPGMIAETMAGPFNVIQGSVPQHKSGDTDGIGYSVYYYTWFIMGSLQDVKILSIEGIRPTSKTIEARKYPLIAEVYVVIRSGESPTATSVLLRDWLLSPAGQYTVYESGYVNITPFR